MKVSESDIEIIVNSVLQNIESQKIQYTPKNNKDKQLAEPLKIKEATVEQFSSSSSGLGDLGVFEEMDNAIVAGDLAQKKYVKDFQLQNRERIINAIRETVLNHKEELSQRVYEETKLGNIEDKIAKHELTALKTPGTEDLSTEAISGDDGLTIIEQGPYGLIGAVTPVTNPTETIINNSIGMIAAGNAVVFNVHPGSKKSSAYAIQLLNKSIVEAGGPENLITMVKEPTMETMQKLVDSPKIRLLVGTGGVGLVRSLLQSGKKAIGAGAGNPPVIVDETADIEHASKKIIEGASFDNNLLCIAEKAVFVLDEVADDLIFHMLNNKAYMLDKNQLKDIMGFALDKKVGKAASGCSLDNQDYQISKAWVGKDAELFLNEIDVIPENDIKLLICEVDYKHPIVQIEQMMPILPIVRVNNLDEAINLAVETEKGNRHTAVMHSKNIDNLTRFAQAIDTTIFVKNSSSLAGVGFDGEGHTTMTIAGPTGEGVTSAKTFTRQRRCVLAEGGFRIIG